MVREAYVVELIFTCSTTGEGKPGDPVREIEQYWTKTGKLVATVDKYMETTRECQGCKGTGKVPNMNTVGKLITDECGHCSGSGRMSK